MRYLIISDIHSNWDALDAVLADAAFSYDRILCLGDLVGYGPDPNRVVDWIREHAYRVIRGNHDKVCCGLENDEWFNPVAQQAVRWTRAQLSETNLQYLRQLPKGPLRVEDFYLVHGSPLDEDEYILSTHDVANQFEYLEGWLYFFGHTHVQGAFQARRHGIRYLEGPRPQEGQRHLELEESWVYLVNPGSVGQPRDGDRRAAYLIYDSEARTIELKRAEYDVERTWRKIAEAGLPQSLADRLLFGV